MRLWSFLRWLKPAGLWKISILCLGHLTKLLPTWKATKKSVHYASEIYGKQHHKNTPANAFRHALWNYLIAANCSRSNRDLKEVMIWTEKITELHEDLFPNKELARAMDLHNNRVGRLIFLRYRNKDEDEIVNLMRELAEASFKLTNLDQVPGLAEDRLSHMVDNDEL